MFEEYQEYIEDLVVKRLNDIIVGLKQNNGKYKEYKNLSMKLEDGLIELVDEKVKQLYLDREDAVNAKMGIACKEIYMAGVKDGINIGGVVEGMRKGRLF